MTLRAWAGFDGLWLLTLPRGDVSALARDARDALVNLGLAGPARRTGEGPPTLDGCASTAR